MKTIMICGKEYPISCNAYTRFQYKTIFNRNMVSDIQVINDFRDMQTEKRKELEKIGANEETIDKEINKVIMENLDDFLDVVERIAYILIFSANNKMESFENWLKGIDKIDLSENWIGEVTEIAVDSFC